jgi:membrane associated rhomboid family serine protease
MIPLRDNITSRKFPIINYILIALNIAAFLYQMKLSMANALIPFIYHFGVVPILFSQNNLLHISTLFTSQFLHGGLMHIFGNMVFLYIFGDNVEDRFGHVKYLFFYLSAGAVAGLAQIYFNPRSDLPMIGASGAIAGVLGAYFLFYPSARILTLIPLGFFTRLIEIPAFFFLGLWFLMQTFSGTSALYQARATGADIGGIAWWAHAGGFVYGLALALIRKMI